MPSKVVKCSTCNIVINELLAFVNNRIDVMDEESISRICISAFSESDIVAAKDLLFDSISTTLRKKVRKRSGKSLRNIDDIICVLKESHPTEIPIFVARELHKLPPVLFDHVDVTRLLKDIVKLQQDVKDIKEQYVTTGQLNLLKSEFIALQSLPTVNEDEYDRNVNKNRGAFARCFDYHSGPMGLSPMCNKDPIAQEYDSLVSTLRNDNDYRDIIQPNIINVTSNKESISSQTNKIGENVQKINTVRVSEDNSRESAAVTQQTESAEQTTVTPIVAPAPSQLSAVIRTSTPKSLAEIAQGEWKPQKQDEVWTLVQRKKLRNRFVGQRGNAILDAEEKFKAAEITTPIYIYNVAKEVSTTDILNYVKKKSNLCVNVEQTRMKLDKNYNAFKIFVPKQKMEVFLRSDFWPEGIAYRRFFQFPQRKSGTVVSEKDLNKHLK